MNQQNVCLGDRFGSLMIHELVELQYILPTILLLAHVLKYLIYHNALCSIDYIRKCRQIMITVQCTLHKCEARIDPLTDKRDKNYVTGIGHKYMY